MADWNGASRSNYVKIQDLEGLEKSLEGSGVDLRGCVERDAYCLLATGTGDGSWPSYLEAVDDGEEVEFTFESHVMPFVAEGEVLVAMTAGYEKLRYVSGYASAFIRRQGKIERTDLDLCDVYSKAEQAFGVTGVTAAEY